MYTRKEPTTMAQQDDDNPNVAADFATFVENFAEGRLNDRLSARFKELVAACRETGRKGAMTIKLQVKPEGTMAHVTCESKITKPEHPVPGHSFYSSEDGELTTEDPRQLKLPGKIIGTTGVPRIVRSGGDDDNKH
jgi:hypothetical protein